MMLRELPPDMDASQQKAMRDKARRNGTDGAFADRTDEWLANELRMLDRNDLYHEAFCTAARDRIMKLSMQLAKVKPIADAAKEFVKMCPGFSGTEIGKLYDLINGDDPT